MEFRLNYMSQLSLHAQLRQRITESIERGNLVKYSVLPSVRELSKTLDVSEVIIKRAYDDLVENNTLVYKKGLGYIVNE
jgi:DNA-binding GntR family transcriptional regulator